MPPSSSACASRTFRIGKLAEREMFSDAVAVGNRRRDEIFPDLHRVRQIVAQRQRRADRGGIGAAGAVRGHALHERRGEQQLRFAVEENVNRLAGIPQVAAFQQHRAAVAGMDFPGGFAHGFGRGDFCASEDFRLVQVRRDERGERQEFFLEEFFRRRLQQPRAAGGNHHRVNDQARMEDGGWEMAEKFCDDGNVLRREQHAGLHCRRRQFLEDGFDLLAQHFGRTRLDGEHAPGILRGEAGDGARAVNAERGEGFQISLDARAAAAVGAGDGQGDGQSFSRSHPAQCRVAGDG